MFSKKDDNCFSITGRRFEMWTLANKEVIEKLLNTVALEPDAEEIVFQKLLKTLCFRKI